MNAIATGGVGPQPQRSSSSTVLGTILVTAGLVLLLLQTGLLHAPWPVLPAVVLMAVGGCIVVGGVRGVWHGGLVVLAVALTLVTAASLTAERSWSTVGGGVGDRWFSPAEAAELQAEYELGAGTLRLDLTELTLPEGTTAVAVDVGVGDARVRVPEDTAVRISADNGTGEIVLFGDARGGLGVDHAYETEDFDAAGRRLELDLHVGMGRIEVTR